MLLLADILGRTEDWQNDHFAFEEVSRKLPRFALCYRATVCAEMDFRQLEVFASECAKEKYPDATLRFAGIDVSTQGAIGALESFRDSERSSNTVKLSATINRVRNTLSLPILLAFYLIRIFRLVGLTAPSREDCFMMADYVGDEDDNKFYEAGQAHGDVVLVPRSPATKFRSLPPGLKATIRHRKEGVIPLVSLLPIIVRCLRDVLSIFSILINLDLQKFAIAISWPFKTVEFEAFFRRGHPRVFFARDCYNHDHILRHQVLREIGAVHIGLNVGYPCYSILFPTMRYISFDNFLVYGRELYEKHYQMNWPSEMELVPIGPFRVSENVFRSVRQGGNSGDIAIFAGLFIHEPHMIKMVQDIAKNMPDRKIFLQVKPVFRNTPAGLEYVRACTKDLPNVVPTEANVYDILDQVTYSVTDPSSIVVEAMSLGRVSFLADVSSWQRSCYFWRLEDIIVRSGCETSRRIRALEAGLISYPWQELESVAHISETYFMHEMQRKFSEISNSA
ncbi:MAG: hypothetical protein VW875_18095 [Planctomycetaceae bacterium]